jgi:hypothetical protein
MSEERTKLLIEVRGPFKSGKTWASLVIAKALEQELGASIKLVSSDLTPQAIAMRQEYLASGKFEALRIDADIVEVQTGRLSGDQLTPDELADEIMDLTSKADIPDILMALAGYLDGLVDNVWDSYNGGTIDLGDDSRTREEVVSLLQSPYEITAGVLRGLAESAKEHL